MIRLLYNLLFHALILPAAPALYLWGRMRRPRFRDALAHRLGRTRGLAPRPSAPPLWLHGVSLGEVQALQPLVQAWHTAHPDRPVLLSSSTETGLAAATRLYPDVPITPFPLDTPPAVAALLDYWRPGCVALLETELWPNFFWACQRRGIPLCLVSGRISERTLRSATLFRPVWRDVLGCVRTFAMQSPADADRIRTLGAPADRVQVLGNLKWDAAAVPEPNAGARWRTEWDVAPDEPLILWGSTHDGEERLALETWRAVRTARTDVRLVIVPRHPERFDAVSDALRTCDIRFHRRSAGPAADWDVLLLDAVGELAATYPAATLAVMGGTFAPVGGHNILEPLAAGVPLLVGPHTRHIRHLVDAAAQADAVVQTDPEGLSAQLLTLLNAPARRAALSANGRSLLAAHTGVATRLVHLLDTVWPEAAACGP